MNDLQGVREVRVRQAGVDSTRGHVMLWAMTAGLLMLAFPRPGWSWAAHVALAPAAILAIRSVRPWRLFWTGYLVFAAWWILQIWWMTPVTLGGTIGLSLYMALYQPMAILMVRQLGRTYRAPMVLALPLAWVSVEFFRGWFLSGGFGWFAISYSQGPWLPEHGVSRLAQSADLAGHWTVGMIVCMTSGMLVDVLVRPWAAPGTRREGGWLTACERVTAPHAVGAWAAVLVLALAYGQWRINQTDSVAQPGPRIAVVQTNVPLDNRVRQTAEQRLDNWRTLQKLTRQALPADTDPAAPAAAAPAAVDRPGPFYKPDLVVWPETMIPSGLNAEAVAHFATTWHPAWKGEQLYDIILRDLAKATQSHLIVGAHAYYDWVDLKVTGDDGREGVVQLPGRRFNSAYHYHPDGTQSSDRYDKIHRVPFGEYIPWVDGWPWLKKQFIAIFSPYDVDHTLQPGSRVTVFELKAATYAGPQAPTPPKTPPLTSTVDTPAEDAAATSPTSQAGQSDTDLSKPAAPDAPYGFDDAHAGPRVQRSAWARQGGTVRVVTPICFEDSLARAVHPMVFGPTNSGDDGGEAPGEGPGAGAWGKRADVIVNLTNDGWFIETDQPLQHLQMAAFRSIETRTPTARSVNCGVSGFVDSAGRIEKIVRDGDQVQDVEGIAVHTVSLDPRVPLFAYVGRWPMILATGWVVLMTGLGVWMDRRGGQSAADGPGRDRAPSERSADQSAKGSGKRTSTGGSVKSATAVLLSAALILAAASGPIYAQTDDDDAPGAIATDLSGSLRDAASSQVIASIQSDDPFLRANAMEALAWLPDQAPAKLAAGVGDPHPAVRFAALVTVGKLRLTALAGEAAGRVNDPSPSVRGAAIFALKRLGREADLTYLSRMLASQQPAARGNAALLLGMLGDRGAAPMMKQLAATPMPRVGAAQVALVRIQIAEAVVKLGDEASLDAIRAALYSPIDEVRVLAVQMLGRLGDARMAPAIAPLTQQRPIELQLAAAEALARLGRPAPLQTVLEAARSRIATVRAQAAITLGLFSDAPAREMLANLLQDSEEQVRLAAAAGVLQRSPR